jgi:hypothetical protein
VLDVVDQAVVEAEALLEHLVRLLVGASWTSVSSSLSSTPSAISSTRSRSSRTMISRPLLRNAISRNRATIVSKS